MFVVVFEDAAALAGIAVAFCGIFFGRLLGIGWLDGAAAIGVGVILMGVAMFLILEVRKLLIGERAQREVQEEGARGGAGTGGGGAAWWI